MVAGVGMPEKQSSNREVVRRQRKKRVKEVYQRVPLAPLKRQGKDSGVSLSLLKLSLALVGARQETCISQSKLCL